MTLRTVMTVYGTRPEAIKVAPVLAALEEDERFASLAVATGQHREMLDQVHDIFGIEPVHDLDVMRPGQSLNAIVSRTIIGLDALLERYEPDAVLVQGDTSTAMAAGVAAFNRRIPVVHLEAGLRTGDLDSPFPEEANRRLVARVATLHLAPTVGALDNLLREGTPRADIVVTGNTVIDALLRASHWHEAFQDSTLGEIVSSGRRIVLATTHRRENLGNSMHSIGGALAEIATARPDLAIVLPLHRNPAVRAAVLPRLRGIDNVHVTEPLSYAEFTRAMRASTLVLTDSGGVQEEAPSLGKPVLVLRDTTERPEAVAAGTVRLIGTARDRIVAESLRLLDDDDAYAAMANAVNPYGDGRASGRAVAAIAALLGVGSRSPEFGVA